MSSGIAGNIMVISSGGLVDHDQLAGYIRTHSDRSNFNPLLHNTFWMPLKYHIFEKYYGKWTICSFGANAPSSMIFSKAFKTQLNFLLNCFNVVLK